MTKWIIILQSELRTTLVLDSWGLVKLEIDLLLGNIVIMMYHQQSWDCFLLQWQLWSEMAKSRSCLIISCAMKLQLLMVKVDPLAEWKTTVPSVVGGDAHCCDRAGFDKNEVTNTTYMLCLRGECDFLTKAENAAAIGAGMMIVGNYNDTLTRMGSDPPYR